MAWSEIYVDPSLNSNSGTGTIGDPFGDLEYGIVQSTFDLTNGTRVNIKDSAAEVLTQQMSVTFADTSVSAAWVPVVGAPLIFQGYTTLAGDGGVALIDTNSQGMQSNVTNYWSCLDLDVYNAGGQITLRCGIRGMIARCKVHGSSGTRGILTAGNCEVIDNYVYDHGGSGIDSGSGRIARNILLTGPTYHFANGINDNATSGTTIERNIVTVTGSANGIRAYYGTSVLHNSVYSDGGSGAGIIGHVSTESAFAIENNLIQGFSGVGGKGIDLSTISVAGYLMRIGGNAVYDCTTPYDLTPVDGVLDNIGDNETLSASPFTDAANNDFSPVDTGNVKEGSVPAGWLI